jgi:uncharacterized membrane protein YhaH (DUF805 family)
MTNILQLLTTFHGRINRTRWWIGFIITGFGGMIGTLMFNPDLLTSEGVFTPNWPDTLWQIAWLVPFAAIITKRCNDRDWPSWLPWLVPALCGLVYLSPHVGFDVDPEAGIVGAFTFWVVVVALVAVIIDNGFIRGTDGLNRYGPDPLAKGQTPA